MMWPAVQEEKRLCRRCCLLQEPVAYRTGCLSADFVTHRLTVGFLVQECKDTQWNRNRLHSRTFFVSAGWMSEMKGSTGIVFLWRKEWPDGKILAGRQLSDRITELFHLLNIKILFFSSKHFVFSILFCTFVPGYTNISKRIIYGKGQIRGAVTEQAVPLWYAEIRTRMSAAWACTVFLGVCCKVKSSSDHVGKEEI